MLANEDLSATTLYKNLGYLGNTSKTFRQCIEELMCEAKIEYKGDKLNSSNNLITRLK